MGDRTAGGDRVGRVRENTRVDQVARGNKEAADLLDNTQKGDEHLAYINSLPYTVQVGDPRRVALEKQGKDTSLKGITEEERTKAQEQLATHGQLLTDWAKKNGISKDHATDERYSLRAKIIDDYYNKGSYAKGKQAFLILGLPAAGKSSLADPLADNMDAIIVDSDEFKKRLPEFANGAGANYLHEESSDMADELLTRVIKNGDNLVFPVVGKTPKSLQEKITLLKQAGYDVHLGYMDLPMAKALQRATDRYILEGRLVNLEYIQSVGDRPLKNFNAIKNNPDITDYALYSNDVPFGEKPKLIEGTDYLSNSIDSGKKAVNNEDTKAVNNDDTSRTESGRTIEGSGSETSGERSTEAGRGMGQEHLVSGERAAVLRAGEDQDDGSVRDRDTDDLRSGEETAGERVSERGHNVSRRDDTGGTGVSSTRGNVGGGDDATSGSTRHADGSTKSVGRSSDNDERTGSGQPDEQTERVEKRPKPETIRRGRFYSTETERQAFAEEMQSAGKRMEYNKDAINTYLRLTDNGRIKDMVG
ncbi:MAG: zeta toxin family protein [Negativicoccus succinicivorans]|nr:zeta toxin family protein [Negativicoccus succinicivorans]